MTKVTIALLVCCVLVSGVALGLGAYALTERDQRVEAVADRDQCLLSIQAGTAAQLKACDIRVEACQDSRRAEVRRCQSECAERATAEVMAVELTEDTGRLVDELREVLGYE